MKAETQEPTKAQRIRLALIRSPGRKRAQIARDLGCTPAHVTQVARQMGLPPVKARKAFAVATYVSADEREFLEIEADNLGVAIGDIIAGLIKDAKAEAAA